MSLKVKGLREMQKAFDTAARAMGAAEARAVKRTGTTIIATQSRGIVETVNLKVGTVKRELRTVQQPTPTQPRVVFEVRQRGVPLAEFKGTRQTRKGVSVQPLKSGSRSTLQAAFIHNGVVYGRATKGSLVKPRYGSPHVGRTPIVKLFGTNVLSQYIKDAIQQAGVDTWEKRLPIELDRETNFALKKAGLL